MSNLNTAISPPITTLDPRDGRESTVSNADYDIVLSTLKSHTGEPLISEYFASAIFKVAEVSGLSVDDLLKSIKGQDKESAMRIMVYYLNQLRSRSTLLGVTPVRAPNFYAARNVLL